MSKFDNFDDDSGFLGGFGFSDTGADNESENNDDGSFSGLSYSDKNADSSFGDDEFYEFDPSADTENNKFNIPLGNSGVNNNAGYGSMNNNGFNGMTGNNNSFSAGNNSQPAWSDSGFSQDHDNVFGSDDYVPLNNSLTYKSIGGETGSGTYSSSSYSINNGKNSSYKTGIKMSIIIYIASVIMFLTPLTFFFVPTLKAFLSNDGADAVVYKPVTALVTNVEKDMTSSGIDSICSIKYTYNGKEYTDNTLVVHSNIERGQNLSIYVNQADPSKASVTDLSKNGKQADPTFLFVYGFIVLLLLISTISFFSKTKKRAKYEEKYSSQYSSVWNTKFGEKTTATSSGTYSGTSSGTSSNTGVNVHIGQSVNSTSSAPVNYKPHKSSYAGSILFIVVGLLFATVGFIGLVYHISSETARNNVIKNGISVEATCTYAYAPGASGTIKVNGKIVNYFADVKYEYKGKSYNCSHVELSAQAKKGDTIAVYITEDNPGVCFAAGNNSASSTGSYFLFGIFAFLGSVAVAVGIGTAVSIHKQNKALNV